MGSTTASLRVAEKTGAGWRVHQWLKKAVLLSFRLNDMAEIAGGPVDPERGAAQWWDKVPSKFAGWSANRFRAAGFRAVPGAIVRHSAYIAPNVVLMPSFVNVGAHVGRAPWSIPGRRSAPAPRSARIATFPAGSGSAACSSRCRPSRSSSRTIALSARAARSSRGSSSAKARCWRWAPSSAPTTEIVDRNTGDIHRGRVPAYSVVVPGSLPGQRSARRQPRPQPLLRGHRQDRRRADPRQDRDQRAVARMTSAGSSSRRPSPPS